MWQHHCKKQQQRRRRRRGCHQWDSGLYPAPPRASASQLFCVFGWRERSMLYYPGYGNIHNTAVDLLYRSSNECCPPCLFFAVRMNKSVNE